MLRCNSANRISRRALAPGFRSSRPGASALRLISQRDHSATRSGLTLLELVIVMVILAALTGIAVRAIEPVADQARYEQTLKSFEQIEQAYLLRTLGADSTVSYQGFIADIGRLPIAVGTDPQTQLSEFWAQGALPAFSVSDFDDPDTSATEAIPVAAGWRGPYLNLPPGPAVLRDGFGNDLTFFTQTGAVAVAGDPIAGMTSAGANNQLNDLDIDYDRDVTLPGGLWLPGRYEGTLPVSIKDSTGADPTLNAGETLSVRLYGPVDGVPSRISSDLVAAGVTGEFDINLADVPCGPRVLWVAVTTGSAPNESVVRQSTYKQIMVSPGMNATITMKIN